MRYIIYIFASKFSVTSSCRVWISIWYDPLTVGWVLWRLICLHALCLSQLLWSPCMYCHILYVMHASHLMWSCYILPTCILCCDALYDLPCVSISLRIFPLLSLLVSCTTPLTGAYFTCDIHELYNVMYVVVNAFVCELRAVLCLFIWHRTVFGVVRRTAEIKAALISAILLGLIKLRPFVVCCRLRGRLCDSDAHEGPAPVYESRAREFSRAWYQ